MGATTPVSLETPADNPGTPMSRSEISKALQAMTVLVLTENGFGSGVIVGPNRILTNRHVIESAGPGGIWVLHTSLPTPIEAKIAATSPTSDFNRQDFALLSLPLSIPSPDVSIAPGEEALENVYAAGFPNSIVSNDSGLKEPAQQRNRPGALTGSIGRRDHHHPAERWHPDDRAFRRHLARQQRRTAGE